LLKRVPTDSNDESKTHQMAYDYPENRRVNAFFLFGDDHKPYNKDMVSDKSNNGGPVCIWINIDPTMYPKT
jgi:hypothetical protein